MRAENQAAMVERIVKAADRLFYHQGIRAIGVDTVAAEAGISKRTLYNYFPSKDDLIVAYLSSRFRPIQPSDAAPAEQLLKRFDQLEAMFEARDYRGCPFVNAVAELGSPKHPINKIALAFKEQRRVWYRTLLEQLGVAEPDGLATQIMLLSEGAITAALVRGDPGMARAARDAVRTLLIAAGVQISPKTDVHRLSRNRTASNVRPKRKQVAAN